CHKFVTSVADQQTRKTIHHESKLSIRSASSAACVVASARFDLIGVARAAECPCASRQSSQTLGCWNTGGAPAQRAQRDQKALEPKIDVMAPRCVLATYLR